MVFTARQQPRCRKSLFKNFCLLMTVLWPLAQMKNYGPVWTTQHKEDFSTNLLLRNTEPSIFVNDQKLSAGDKFTYLGSTLSHAGHIDEEGNIIIIEAIVTFGKDLHQAGKKTEGLSGCRITNSFMWVINLDSLLAPCQEIEPS